MSPMIDILDDYITFQGQSTNVLNIVSSAVLNYYLLYGGTSVSIKLDLYIFGELDIYDKKKYNSYLRWAKSRRPQMELECLDNFGR